MLATTLILSCLLTASLGSHWRYGQVTWKLVSGSTVEFTAEFAWRSALIGSIPTFDFGDGTSVSLLNTKCTNNITPCPAQDIVNDRYYYQEISQTTDIKGEQATLVRYVFRHTYPSTDQVYTWTQTSSARLGSLIVGGSEPYQTQGSVSFNNGNTGSPVSNISPVQQFILGQQNIIDLSPVDNDGEPVTCRQATSAESRISSNNYYTITADCKLIINIPAGTYQVGDKWAAQITMETANGDSTPLDFIFEAVDSLPECKILNMPIGGFVVTAGNKLTVNMEGTDPPSGQQIEVININLPQGATLTPPHNSIINPLPASVTLEWTPDMNQIGAFSATVGIKNANGATAQCTIPITVEATPAPTHAPKICNNKYATCEIIGDPHFTTFDGLKHNFQGTSIYNYVYPCRTNNRSVRRGLPFEISAKQWRCQKRATCIQYAIVKLFDSNGNEIYRIRISNSATKIITKHLIGAKVGQAAHGGPHTIDATNNWVYTIKYVKARRISFVARFIDPISNDIRRLIISYDNGRRASVGHMVIRMSTCFRNQACGLCGYYDGKKGNDLAVKRLPNVRRLQENDDNDDTFNFDEEFDVLEITGIEEFPIPDQTWDNLNKVGDSECNQELTNEFDTEEGSNDIDNNENNECGITDIEQISANCLNNENTIIQCENIYNLHCKNKVEQCQSQENAIENINESKFLKDCRWDACANNEQLFENTFENNDFAGVFDTQKDICEEYLCEFEENDDNNDNNGNNNNNNNDDNCEECTDGIKKCANDNCSGIDENPHCAKKNEIDGSCEKNGCECGFFQKTVNHACVECDKAIQGCLSCVDFQGCIQCDYKNNWKWFWDAKCKIGRCMQDVVNNNNAIA